MSARGDSAVSPGASAKVEETGGGELAAGDESWGELEGGSGLLSIFVLDMVKHSVCP